MILKTLSENESCSVVTAWMSMEFSRPEYWSGQAFLSPGDLSNPEIKPRCPVLQADSLPAEPQGKSKNTGVCSLSLPQGIFLTQEQNWGLLHCRQILYQLSYQGRPTNQGRWKLFTLIKTSMENPRKTSHLIKD